MFELLGSHPRFRSALTTFFSFETLFVLYLFAGFYKGSEFLEWVPIDLTLLMLVGSVAAGTYVFWRRGFSLSQPALALIITMAAFAGWVLLSLLWAPTTIYGKEKAIQFAILNGWALAGAAIVIDGDEQRLKRFYGFVMGLAFLVALETMRVYLPHKDVRSYQVLGSSYQTVGRLVGLGFLVAVAAFFDEKKSVWRSSVFLILSSGFFWVLLFVGARGPFLAASLAMLLILALMRVSVSKKALFVSVLAGVYIISTMTMGPSLRTMYRFNVILAHEVGWQLPGIQPTPTTAPTRIPTAVSTRKSPVIPSATLTPRAVATVIKTKTAPEATSARPAKPTPSTPTSKPKPRIPAPKEIPNKSVEMRQKRFFDAIRLWLAAPLIGVGVGGFAFYYPADQFRVYPHNMILEVLSELGIVGIALWLVMFAVAFWSLAMVHRWQMPMVIIALGFFTFAFLNAMISGDIVSNRHVFTALGLLVATSGLWTTRK